MGIYDRSITDNERYMKLGKQAEVDKQRAEAEAMARMMGDQAFKVGLAAGFVNAPKLAVNQELQDAVRYNQMQQQVNEQNRVNALNAQRPQVVPVDQRASQGLALDMANQKDYELKQGMYK